MFVCEPCHDKSTCTHWMIEGFMRSRGRCEVCGESADCLDCHGYKTAPLPPEARAVLRDAEIYDGMNPEQKAYVRRLDDASRRKDADRIEVVRLLRLVSEGRREYARAAGANKALADVLTSEADLLAAAAKIADGDKQALYGLLPSWMWSEAGLS